MGTLLALRVVDREIESVPFIKLIPPLESNVRCEEENKSGGERVEEVSVLRDAALVCFDKRRNKPDLRAMEEPVEKMLFVSLLCESIESEGRRLAVARLNMPATVDVKETLCAGAEVALGDCRLSEEEGRRWWCESVTDAMDSAHHA